MANRSTSEHLIRIIVQGVNRAGDVVEQVTRAVDKHTGAVDRQAKAVDRSGRSVKDAQADFERFTKAVRDGEKDYESATFGLKQLAAEMDRLARREPIGSAMFDDLHRSATQARELAEQLRLAHETERRNAEQEARDRVRREHERQAATEARAKAERAAEATAAKQRSKNEADRQRESDGRAKAAAKTQEEILKGLADLAIKEQERIERERIASEQRAENARIARLRLRGPGSDRATGSRTDLGRGVGIDPEDGFSSVPGRLPLGRGDRVAPGPPERRPGVVRRVRTFLDELDPPQRVRDFASDGPVAAAEAGVRRLSSSSRTTESGVSRLERAIARLSARSDHAGFSTSRLAGNIRGLLVIGVIAFSQQLISAFVALAASALAVAAAAAQAGAALGGAFVAAAGQALPTIGLLVAAFGRIGAVFEAVKLFNVQATKAGYDQAKAADTQADSADRQAAAADRVASAQEQAAASSQRVQDATDALTEARERARQKIEDLGLAEREASRSQFDAGQDIARAISSGDVGALEELRLRQDQARLNASRTDSEASTARANGVDRAPEVLKAVRDLDEANTALDRSRRELEAAGRATEAAGRAATQAATAGSAADRSLEQALAQLTAAELALYESSKRIQARFRTLFRPVTDIIVRAFTRGVDRASSVLDDSRIVGTARRLAKSLADSMDVFSKGATSDRGLDFFRAMGDEATRNIPLLTRLGVGINRIMAAIAVASGPALREFIRFFVDLAVRGEEATGSRSGMARLERFFLRGEEMAESFLHLGGAIIGLFAALAGAGGAETGKDLVDDLTASIQRATRWIDGNRGKVVRFFHETADATRSIAGGIFAIGRAAVELFNSDKVVSFVEAFREVLLPALVTVITALGTITYLFTKLLSLPVVSQIAQVALSIFLLNKAFSIFGKILIPMSAGLLRVGAGFTLLRRAAFLLRLAGAALAGPWGLILAAIVTAVVLLDKQFHFIGPTMKYVGETATVVFDLIKGAVEEVGDALGFLAPTLKSIGKLLLTIFKFSPLGFLAGVGGKLVGFIHGLGDSKRAVDDVRKAEDELAESQRRSAAAQRDLTDARRAARRELSDLESSVRSGRLQVREARFGVRDARTELSSLRARGAPRDEVEKAELRLDQARENLRETTRSATRAEQDYEAAKTRSTRADGDVAKASEKARKARAEERESVRSLDRASREALSSKDSFIGAASKLGLQGALVGGLGIELRSLGGEFDRSTGKIERLRGQVDKLKDRLSHLREGTNEYRTTAERLRRKQEQLNDVMQDADAKGKRGARGPRAIGVSALNAARAVDRANASIAKGFNQIAKQLGGVKAITYNASGSTTSFGGGESITADTGDITARATGGWIGSGRGRQGPDDRVIRVGDGEAVLAVPHQRPVEEGLRLRSQLMGGPGNLDQLFSRVKGYVGAFATGGRVGRLPAVLGAKPGFGVFMQLFQRLFGRDLSVISGSRPGSRVAGTGTLSNHSAGNAIDIQHPLAAGANQANQPPRNPLDRLYPFIKSRLPFLDLLWRTITGGNHYDHVHWGAPPAITATVAAARRFIAKMGSKLGVAGGVLEGLSGVVKTPKITGPAGRLRDLATRAVRKLVKATNDRLESTAPTGDFTTKLGDFKGGGGASANIALGRKMAAAVGWVGAQWRALRELWMGESGWLATAHNPSSGAHGIPQALPGSKMASAGKDWFTNAATQIKWGLGYIKGRYQNPVSALSFWKSRSPHWYETGGPVWGSGPKPAMLHGGEHVVTATEVMRAGGHKAMYALRKMLGGGGQGARGSYALGGQTSSVGGDQAGESDAPLTVVGASATVRIFNTSLDGILGEIRRVRKLIAKLKTRSSKFATEFGRQIGIITDDGGLLDQGAAALQRVVDRTARRLKRATFKRGKDGLVTRELTTREEAEGQIVGIDQQIVGSQRLRGVAGTSLRDVDRRLKVLRRGGVTAKERKAYETLVTARRSLIARIEALDGQIADSVEARFQAQEQVLTTAIDEVNAASSRKIARADLVDRTANFVEGFVGRRAEAFGIRGQALEQRGAALTAQRAGLLPLLRQAQEQGSTTIANDLLAQIEELNTAMAENTAAMTQNTVAFRAAEIESIARTAQRASGRFDLADRVATLVEAGGGSVGAFALRGQTLHGRRAALAAQRDALAAQLAGAQASYGGTTAEQQQIEDLTDQIEDLGVQLQENSQAVEHNTVAARQAAIDAITSRGGFLGGVLGGLSGIVKSLGTIAGKEDVTRLKALAEAAAGVLGQTGSGLREQLLSGFGVDLRGLDPSALVDVLKGLNFDSIESTLTVEQRQQFEALIQAIIENAGAVVDNTQQLSEITGSQQQSFSTTAWQLFREAIFNGSGGLLPQYRFSTTMPQPIASSSSTGSLSSLMPGSSRATGTNSAGGDTINVNLTNPTETTDPNWIGEVIATKRPLARAGR